MIYTQLMPACSKTLATLLNGWAEANFSASALGSALEYDTVVDHIRIDRRAELERNIKTSELDHDVSVALRRLLYLEPLIKTSVSGFGIRRINLEDALNPGLFVMGFGTALDFNPYGPPIVSFLNNMDQFFATQDPFEALETFNLDIDSMSKTKAKSIQAELAREAQLFLSTILTGGTTSFAAEHGLPIKTAAGGRAGQVDHSIGGEAYQLFKVQFDTVRYPVLTTIGDALRLRDDPNLERYKSVIFEYSDLVRSAGSERLAYVLDAFKQDLSKASLEWRQRERAVTINGTVVFWLSIALTAFALITNTHFDLVAIPASIYAQFYNTRFKNDFGWVAFGRT